MALKAKMKIKDLGWNRIRNELNRAKKKPHVQVGVYGAEASKSNQGVPNIKVASIHEFGGGHVPQRSFLRTTFDLNTDKITKMAKRLQDGVIAGKSTTRQALSVLGEHLVGLVRRRMSAGIPPPLKAATIRRKGSSKPLIDTGQLRASIDSKVNNA